MHPLLTLWLMVFASTVVLAGVFYLAENYSHIIGNFYFLAGAFFGSYVLYLVIGWLIHRKKKPTP
ncbi:MAG: hypothetical protein ACE5J1_02565 [Nitrospiria bacterium]